MTIPELKDSSNWHQFLHKFKAYLETHGISEVLDETPLLANANGYKEWKLWNEKARGVFKARVNQSFESQITNKIKNTIQAFETAFGQEDTAVMKTTAHLVNLYAEFDAAQFHPNSNPLPATTRMDQIRKELNNLGINIPENLFVSIVLDKLPVHWEMLKQNWIQEKKEDLKVTALIALMDVVELHPFQHTPTHSSTCLMPTLHFWDKAPDGQWPIATLVQEFYKEIYPAHPDRVMAGDLPYHRLWHLATLSSTVISPDSFMALLLQHLILARHTCLAAVFFLSQSDPTQAFLYQPTTLSEESNNELTRITPLVEKYAHSIIQEDPFLRNTAIRLDPLQDFLYLAPQTDESTFRDILDTQIGPYAQAIAEIGVLSVSTALDPGALRA
ncbi:hypothetical protein PQX77_017966 [Marasmius sp. AFHP31]|nr:hypothetical protein PQX77_017966 [Marasmius sp. AFHP31]